MEKSVRIFESHQEAEAANLEFYRKLTPEYRLRTLFQIIADHDHEGEAYYNTQIQKVCRIIKREES